MATGFIKRAILEKRFGFIAVSGGQDCYFRSDALSGAEWDERLEGRRVEFDMTSGHDGRFRAVNVRAL